MIVSFSSEQISKVNLYELLCRLSDTYTPPLTQQVNLDNYASKLYEKANIIYAYIDGGLEGLIAYYVADNKCFITSFGIDKKYHSMGLGLKLFNRFLEEIAKKSITNLELETQIENLRAIKFYKKHGFEIVSSEENKLFLRKKINEQ